MIGLPWWSPPDITDYHIIGNILTLVDHVGSIYTLGPAKVGVLVNVCATHRAVFLGAHSISS